MIRGRTLLALAAGLTACAERSPTQRYPEAAAAIVADLQPGADLYFERPVKIEPIGRTTSGAACGWADMNGRRFFVHADDKDVVALSADSDALAGWGGLCTLDKTTPVQAPIPIVTRPKAKMPRAYLDAPSPSPSEVWVAAMNAVRPQMKAPQSARFSEVSNRRGRVCGLVDAENAYGGRAGSMRFIYADGVALLEEAVPSPSFTSVWNTYCS